MYDLDFRNFDPVLGRMNGVDPMADSYSPLTPYNYSFNNPISFNDPSGADPNPGEPDHVTRRGITQFGIVGSSGIGFYGRGLDYGDGSGMGSSNLWDSMWGAGGWNNVGGIANGNQSLSDYYSMSESDYIAKYATTVYQSGKGTTISQLTPTGYWLSTNSQVGGYDPVTGEVSVRAIRDRLVVLGDYLNGTPTSVFSYRSSQNGSESGSWLNMFSLEGEISGGVQGGFNLNNMVRANLNLASTPLFGFSVGRENKVDHLERYKNGITIKQSASLGLSGFSGAWDRQFLGKSFGTEGLTDKYTVTLPIPIPFIFGVVNYFNETVVGPDGKMTNQGGLTIDFSGGVIINGSIGFKYYGD